MSHARERVNVSRRSVLKGIGGAATAVTTGVSCFMPAAASGGESVAFQYFHEDWETITNDLDRVASRGYDAIWIQQPAKGAVTKEEQNGRNDPPLGYQPVDLRNFDSELGTETELETLIDTAHDNGVEVYLDTVMNHMAAEPDDTFPYFSSRDFHNEGGIEDWAYQFDPRDDRCYENGSPKDPDKIECDPDMVEDGDLLGLKDLDQNKQYVRDQLKRYMEDIAALGADGYRFDAVKHIPESFFANYANQWAENLDMFRVGEVLSGSTDYVSGYVNAGPGMHAFDYPLYFVLQGVFDHGDMSRLEGAGLVAQNPWRAMPFVENHDQDGPTQYELAHAFVLTIEGYPVVYNRYPDWILENDAITNMVWVKSNLAGGETLWRYTDTDLAVYERESNLLVGLNNSSYDRTKTVETSWSRQDLKDYAGNGDPVTTNSDGTAQITVPSEGWVFYATPGQ
ncbi:alpha-amylase domain-containing protein [Halorhabdus amylolytica]|uniref:alpha-amylase domain-containing protein n=1 Tax=Halorhabdus amylolytica TaxID=2559573 RepID=UPI001B7D7D55|nr:alpha-amylase domain-containing protein [Halorhabdus amylolytica]